MKRNLQKVIYCLTKANVNKKNWLLATEDRQRYVDVHVDVKLLLNAA